MAIRLDMTMSVDGFVAGPDDGPDAPMGRGGFRLFNWLDRRLDPGPSGEVYAETMASRAVLSGRRTYELAGRWGGDHHDGVPIVVLTHDVPDDPPPGSVVYATDVREAASTGQRGRGGRRRGGPRRESGAGAAARPASSTRWSCTSCRCCSGRDGGCSTTSRPGTSSSSWCRLTSPDTGPRPRVTHLRYRVRPRP